MQNSREFRTRRASVGEPFSVENSQVPTISKRLAAGFGAIGSKPIPQYAHSKREQPQPQSQVTVMKDFENEVGTVSRPSSRQSHKVTSGPAAGSREVLVAEADWRSESLPDHLDITILPEDEDLEHQLLSLVTENHQKPVLQQHLQQEPRDTVSNQRAMPGQIYIHPHLTSESQNSYNSTGVRSRMMKSFQEDNSVGCFEEVQPLPIDISDPSPNSNDIWRYLSEQDQSDPSSTRFQGSGSRHSTFGALQNLREFQNPSLTLNPLPLGASSVDSGLMLKSGSKLLPTGQTPSATPPIDFQSSAMNCPRAMYQKRTTSLSHAMMTLALLSASTAQLRFIVAYADVHAYPTLNYFLICTCVVIEVFVGVGYVILARFDFSEDCTDKIHSYLIFGLFIVTAANVIVAVFALDDHICEFKSVRGKARSSKFGVDEGSAFAEERSF